MFQIDLNSFLPAGGAALDASTHRAATGVQTTPLDPHAPAARPLRVKGMYDGPAEFK